MKLISILFVLLSASIGYSARTCGPNGADRKIYCQSKSDPAKCLTEVEPNINQDCESADLSQQAPAPSAAVNCPAGGDKTAAQTEFPNEFKIFNGEYDDCNKKADSAAMRCNPSEDKNIEDTGEIIGGLLDAAGMIGAAQPCSKFGEAMKYASAATGAFRAQCSTAKKSCDDTCKEAVKMVKAMSTKLPQVCKAKQGAEKSKCECAVAWFTERATSKKEKEVAARVKECAGHQAMLQKSMFNINQFALGLMMSKQCEAMLGDQKKSYCEQEPNAPICSFSASVDCNDPETAKSNPTCICEKDPRNSVCTTGVAESSSTLNRAEGVETLSSNDGIDDALKNANFGSSSPFNPDGAYAGAPGDNKNSGSNVEAFGRGGGGGGLGGGGASPQASTGGRGGGGGSRINTDILGGGGGGNSGGSGFSWGRKASASADSERDSRSGKSGFNYAKFLPGKRAPSDSDGLTGRAGPSNWEKVQIRYNANRRSLLPE
ncbi:MAG: hypothetical protein AB7O96_07290 [Pseudobdellovibrionaceae bacterium]